jgi:hypothetical protein
VHRVRVSGACRLTVRSATQRGPLPHCVLVQPCLWYPAGGHNCTCHLRMQSAGAIGYRRHVPIVEHRAPEEIEHEPIDCAALALHEVIGEAVAA